MEFGKDRDTAFANYLEKMQRGSDIGSWMRKLKPLHYSRIGDNKILFVHGGIPKRLRNSRLLSSYSTRVNQNMDAKSDNGPGYTTQYLGDDNMGRDSIFWERDFLKTVRTASPHAVSQMVRKVGVNYVVVGHSVHSNGIESVADCVFDIDVGMCPYFARTKGVDNDPTAIVFRRNKGVFAFYAGDKRRKHQLVQFD